MPQGDKDKYTGKQKRKAEHIAEGYGRIPAISGWMPDEDSNLD